MALKRGREMRAKKLTSKTTTKTITTKTRKMAKRRSYKRKTRSSSSNSFLKGMAPILGAFGYGMFRERISTAIADSEIGQKLPASQFTDEGVMLGLNWAIGKTGLGKNSVMRPVLKAQKSVEWARVGQTVTDMYMSKGTKSKAQSKVTIYPV